LGSLVRFIVDVTSAVLDQQAKRTEQGYALFIIETNAQVVAATADPKKVAAALLPKVVAFIDAVNSKDQAKIASAKKEMQQEADKSDEAVRNSTGPAANAVNAALNNIRLSVMSNDVKTLERAKQLLEDASK